MALDALGSRAGDFSRSDFVRVLGAVALPSTVVWAQVATGARWLPIVIMSIELAVGGLDNLLAHHKNPAGAMPWALRTLGVSALCAAAALLAGQGQTDLLLPLLAAATALSAIGAALEFWRGREYYLNEELRDTQVDI